MSNSLLPRYWARLFSETSAILAHDESGHQMQNVVKNPVAVAKNVWAE